MNNKIKMSSTQQEQQQEQGLPLLNKGEIDFSSIRLEMSESKTGSKNGSLTFDGEKFSFQVDGSTVYSASRYPRDGEGPNVSYSLTIEFDDSSSKQIEAFQEGIKNIIFDNHKAVFGKSYSKDQKSVVSALCNGFLNDKGQLRFNIQTAYKSKNFSVVVVSENDESETVSTFEELEKRIQRNMLVSVIGYVRFYFDRNGKFANSFMCEAIKIRGEGEKKEYQKKDDVIPIEDLDVSSLKASKPAKNEGGKLKSKVSLNGSEWFKLRLTNLLGKFGVSTGMASDGQSQEGSGKHSILACFEQEDAIYEQLKKLDSWALEHGTTNSEAIFDKKLGPKLVEGKYNRSLNEKLGQLKDGTEATFYSTNLSLYTRDGNPNIKVVDSETGTEISVATFDELNGCFPRGTRFDAVVRLEFWYYLGKFGLKMYVKELHIVPRSVEKKSFVFRSGSEEDSAPLTRTASASSPSKAVVASRNSDEEEESGDGDEDEVVSKPKQKSSKKETVVDSDEQEDEEDEEESESEEETPAPVKVQSIPSKVVKKGAEPPSAPTPQKKVVSRK
jgi:hypothetical protein